jgi:hypothetical protein
MFFRFSGYGLRWSMVSGLLIVPIFCRMLHVGGVYVVNYQYYLFLQAYSIFWLYVSSGVRHI